MSLVLPTPWWPNCVQLTPLGSTCRPRSVKLKTSPAGEFFFVMSLFSHYSSSDRVSKTTTLHLKQASYSSISLVLRFAAVQTPSSLRFIQTILIPRKLDTAEVFLSARDVSLPRQTRNCKPRFRRYFPKRQIR